MVTWCINSMYIRPSNLGLRLGAYAPQTSSGFSSWVIYTQNTLRNLDLYITYTWKFQTLQARLFHIMYMYVCMCSTNALVLLITCAELRN